MNGSTDECECAACGRVGRFYRVLRLSAPADAFPDCAVAEGGIDDHLDGYLPLCADCLRVCPTCGCPVIAQPVADLVAFLDVMLGGPSGPNQAVPSLPPWQDARR